MSGEHASDNTGGHPTVSLADLVEINPAGAGSSMLGISTVLRDNDSGNVDVYKTLAHHHSLQERQLYGDYRIEYFENPLVSLLVRHITAELATGYRFVGAEADVKKVEQFWFFHNMESKLEQVTLQGVLLGTGAGDILVKGEEPTGFERLDAATLEGKRDEKGKEEWTQDGKKLNLDKLFLLRLLEYPDQVYGMSFLRASLKSLQGLGNLADDIPAAIKRLAYLERKLELNLEDIKDANKKAKIVRAANELWENYSSATTQVIAIDGKHKLSYVGTDGGNQSRIIPIMDIIEPILSFVMLNFGMALGHIQQTGANKALLQEQEKRARRAIGFLRRKWARAVERQVISRILGINLKEIETADQLPDLNVRLVYDEDPEELQEERRVLVQEWALGLITRAEFRERAGWTVDESRDDVFFYDTPAGQNGSFLSGKGGGGTGQGGAGGGSEGEKSGATIDDVLAAMSTSTRRRTYDLED